MAVHIRRAMVSPRVVEPIGAQALAVRVPPVAVVEANRRLAVILAADIVGYSRLMALDEDGTVQTLATYQEVIAALVAEHQGRIFNLAGDGIMAEFASAVQAVRCAVAIQRMAARRNGDLAEDRQVVFRIGLNLGDVVARGDDLLGDGVNVAARLQALAEPEQICISAAVREQIADKVAFGCASRGEHSLKHIARPVHVYAVDWALQAPLPVAELRKGALPLPDRPSIAVLPFANMSQDADQEYFADGLSEDLITALAKYRWFFVIARNSSFTYKGRAVSVQQVGRELGVRYVVEGSTRRSGNRVRVTAQLVEADTGHHLWADHYDRELEDLFALQDEIVGRVVGAIEPGMMRSETQRARRKTAERMDAWDLVFRGQWHFHHITREHHGRRAPASAVPSPRTPRSPRATSGWSAASTARCISAGRRTAQADLAEETEAVGLAMRLSDGDPYALYALAIHSNSVGQAEQAIAAAQRAIDLQPQLCPRPLHPGRVAHFRRARRAGDRAAAARLSPQPQRPAGVRLDAATWRSPISCWASTPTRRSGRRKRWPCGPTTTSATRSWPAASRPWAAPQRRAEPSTRCFGFSQIRTPWTI